MSHASIDSILQQAVTHHQSGRLSEAESLYRQVLADRPNQPDALHLLGLIAHQRGQNEAALKLIERAALLRPRDATFLVNRAAVLQALDRRDEALSSALKAIQLDANVPQAYSIAGGLFLALNHPVEASDALQKAIALGLNDPRLYGQLGAALHAQGLFTQAIAAHRQAIALAPNAAESYCNLAAGLRAVGELDEAIGVLQQARALRDNDAGVHLALGSAFFGQGRIDEAIQSFRRAGEIQPDLGAAQSALLYALQFDPQITGPALLAEHQLWAQQHAVRLQGEIKVHDNDRAPQRRLRIGYISPDYLNHPVGRFLVPLLSNHDHDRFEIVCFSDVRRPDALTNQHRSCADQWHETAGLNDAAFAEFVRSRRIDILVDLVLHAAANRSLSLVRKPAPIQVCYLAYPGTTGLPTMDYRITDPYLDQPGQNDAYYTEESIRLPTTYWCYHPHEQTPPVGTLPILRNGFVTFGCLNDFAKASQGSLEAWAQILEGAPESRLIIHADRGKHTQAALEFFISRGIDAGRIEFIDRQTTADYLRTYNRIDIALDPFPYNGGTTTCDALWMGVPVVTLAGKLAVHRAGVSLLSNVGLPELIAQTTGQYVQLALDLAGDLPRLEQLRSTLRDRMNRSPLRDGIGFARAMEAVYRQIWSRWCAAVLAQG